MGILVIRNCPYDNQECKEKGCDGCRRRISRKDLLNLSIEKRNKILSRMIEQSSQGVANSCESMGID
jgi:ribosomal protein L11